MGQKTKTKCRLTGVVSNPRIGTASAETLITFDMPATLSTGYRLVAGQDTSFRITAGDADPATAGNQLTAENTKTIYYEVDPNAKFRYTVHFFLLDKDAADEYTVQTKMSVPGLPSYAAYDIIGEKTVDISAMPAGYVLGPQTVQDNAQPNTVSVADKTATVQVTNDNLADVKVYVMPDLTQTLPFTAEYYKDGVLMTGSPVAGTVPVFDPVVRDENLDIVANLPTGYMVDAATSTQLPKTITASDNVVRVYYVPDNNQTYSYTVNYFVWDKTTQSYAEQTAWGYSDEVIKANPFVTSVTDRLADAVAIDPENGLVTAANKTTWDDTHGVSTALPYEVTATEGTINLYYRDMTGPAVPQFQSEQLLSTDTIVSGTGEPGSYITVFVTPGSPLATNVLVDAEGKWTASIPAQPAGTVLLATASDMFGNVSDPAQKTVVAENTAIFDAMSPINNTETTYSAVFTIGGTAEPNTEVRYSIPAGATYEGYDAAGNPINRGADGLPLPVSAEDLAGTATTGADGSFSFTFDRPLADGTQITIYGKDSGGYEKSAGTVSVSDATKPLVEIKAPVFASDSVLTVKAQPGVTLSIAVVDKNGDAKVVTGTFTQGATGPDGEATYTMPLTAGALAADDVITVTATEGAQSNTDSTTVVRGPSYEILYYIEGSMTPVPGIAPNPLTGQGSDGEEITVPTPTVFGYIPAAGQPSSFVLQNPTVAADGTVSGGHTVFIYYYAVDTNAEVSYTVNYYLDGTTDPVPGIMGATPTMTPSGTGKIGDVITIAQPNVVGYIATAGSPTSLTLSSNSAANVATVTYVRDATQYNYSISYYIKDTTTPVPGISPNPATGTGILNQAVTVPHPTLTTGYKVSASQPTSITITATEANNTATVYYEIDETQNSFPYTVNYYIAGTTAPVPGIDQEAGGNATPSGTGYIGETIAIEQPLLSTGYKVVAAQPTTLTVKADGTAAATVYYEVDTAQNSFDYTVNYYISGTTTAVPGIDQTPTTGNATPSGTGYVGQVIPIIHTTLENGYRVEGGQPTSLKVLGDGTATATVYYSIDAAETFGYTINYYLDGTTTPVPGISPNPATGAGVLDQVITVPQPTLQTGYKVMTSQPTSITITATPDDNTATVYYEVDTAQNAFPYEVNYFITGTTTAVPGIDQTPTTGNATPSGTGFVGQSIAIEQPVLTTGYKVSAAQPTTLEVKADGSAKATVYYEVDTEQNTFPYTVNYYISGTTTAVPGIDQTAAGNATPSGTGFVGQSIDILQPTLQTGYKVSAAQPTTITVKGDGTAAATVYYEIDENQKFDYRITYYISGTSTPVPGIAPNPIRSAGYVTETIAIAHPSLATGYKVAENQPTSLVVLADGTAAATVYYIVDTAQNTFPYTVNYYISGTAAPVPGIDQTPTTGNATPSGTGYVGQSISVLQPTLTTGYKVSAAQPTTLTVKADGTAAATVYYEVDQTQNSFAYTVNYYISGTTTAVPGIDQTPTTGNATPSGTGYVGEVIAIDQPTLNNGYRVEGGQPTSLIVNGDGTATATVYYSVNAAETFGYTINYYLDGTTTPVPGISPNPATGTGVLDQVITVPHPTLATGYKVVASQTTSITITATAANNTATVYYEVDTAQNAFPYKVNYYISGTTTKVPGITPNPETGTGYIGESVAIAHPTLTTGYKVSASQPTTITVKADGTAVENVYYEVDTAQSFAYTVNYYISGTTTAVPGIDQTPTTGNATPSGSGYVGQSIGILQPALTTGYKVEGGQPTELQVKADGTAVATVYYSVDATSTYGYTINYYLDGTTTPVPGISPNPTTGTGVLNQVITVPQPSVATGYKVVASQPTSITITATAANNTATVYYEVDTAQNVFPYKVNYYISGTTTKVPGITPNPVTGTGYIGEDVTIAHPTLTTGYKVMTGQPTTITVKADGSASSNVYYEVDQTQNNFAYTVNYYISGTTNAVPGIDQTPTTGNATPSGTGYIGETIAIDHPTLSNGYRVEGGQPTTLEVKADGTAEATVYYSVNAASTYGYTINYYLNGTTTPVPGISPNPTTGTGVLDQVITVPHPTLATGYKVVASQTTSITITATAANNTATVYYEIDTAQNTFPYKVNYYISGTTTAVPGIDQTATGNATPSGTGYVGEVITIAQPSLNNGYRVEGGQPTSLIVNGDGTAEATVYYSIDAAETFGYTINYYLNGGTTPVPGISPNPATGTGVLDQVITVPQPTLQTGYKVMDSQPTSACVRKRLKNISFRGSPRARILGLPLYFFYVVS